ncbi:MAG: hypothetical protein K6T65_04655 [Peptococcaceae bacterium]|nr:hypothetical protein [Peptococcaceae bacterium]
MALVDFGGLTYGFMVALTAMSFDAVGVEFDFWEYHYQLFPLLDILIVYDNSVLAVTYMLVYQYVHTWKTFIVIHVVIALIFAFVAEPALVRLDYYQLLKWKFICSFPVYLAIALVFRGVMGYFKKLSVNRG